MKNNRRLRAFSLIEISIVLLIIGILVAGVTQSSRLISQSKINSAKAMTQSAPVSSIKNLILWIDTTAEASFDDSEEDDALTITNWYDLNPQSSLKSSFAQTTSGSRPTYKSSIINGLPAVLFDGSDDWMQSANFTNIITGSSSVFIVMKTPGTVAAGTILSKRKTTDIGTNVEVQMAATTNMLKYCDSAIASTYAQACYSDIGGTFVASTSYIFSMTYTTNSATGANFYKNGTSTATVSTVAGAPSLAPVEGTNYLYLGKQGITSSPTFYSGYIGEIIVFERVLKSEERKSIEAYLGKKWGIYVTP